MAVITQNYDIDLKATGEYPVVKMSQFDTGSRTIVFTVYDGHDLAHIDGMVARVDGTRSDGVEFSSSCMVGTGSKVSFTINQEMTKHSGKHAAELVILDASGNPAGTQNFVIDVEPAPMVRDSATSADDRTLYDQFTDSVSKTVADKIAQMDSKYTEFATSMTSKADAMNKTAEDISGLVGGSSKQATILDVSVDASTTGTGITGTALAYAEYNPITGLVTFTAKTVDGLYGVRDSKEFQLGTIDAKYLPSETLFASNGSHGNKVYLIGHDRIDDTGYGMDFYIADDGKVYAGFSYPGRDNNAFRPVFYSAWYARGGKYIGVTPLPGGGGTGGGDYKLPVASAYTLGGVKIGNGISVKPDGTISASGGGSYMLHPATSTTLGGVKIGSGISVAADGTISAQGGVSSGVNTVSVGTTTTGEPGTQASVTNSGTAKDVVLDFTIPRGADGASGGGSSYTLHPATSSTLGGVKIGNGISVASDGTISASGGGDYTLPAASASTLGGVKIGSGINVAGDGTISVSGGVSSGVNTVSVGTTTTGAPGTRASVVNSGTAKDVVLDFTIPKGDKGDNGEASGGIPQGAIVLAYSGSPIYLALRGSDEWIESGCFLVKVDKPTYDTSGKPTPNDTTLGATRRLFMFAKA